MAFFSCDLRDVSERVCRTTVFNGVILFSAKGLHAMSHNVVVVSLRHLPCLLPWWDTTQHTTSNSFWRYYLSQWVAGSGRVGSGSGAGIPQVVSIQRHCIGTGVAGGERTSQILALYGYGISLAPSSSHCQLSSAQLLTRSVSFLFFSSFFLIFPSSSSSSSSSCWHEDNKYQVLVLYTTQIF